MRPSRSHYALALVLACTGCPGSLENPERFDTHSTEPAGPVEENKADAGPVGDTKTGAQCPDVPTTVFASKCATGGCHSTTDKAAGLDLQSLEVASRLVGVAAAGGGSLIDPAAPAESVIYTKLSSKPPFGSRMPFGQPLDDATIACVLDWVTDAAGGK